jgi:hypothetical protein
MIKKNVLAVSIILILFSTVQAGNSFGFSIIGNYLIPSDGDYKTIYGEGMIYPELKFEFTVFKGLSIWLGYGYLTANGVIPILEYDAKSNQHHLSLGAGYTLRFFDFMGAKIQLGSFNVYYIEKTTDIEETGLAFGYRADLALMFNLGDHFFLGLSGGYMHAGKSLYGRTVKFGGFKGGLEFGILF